MIEEVGPVSIQSSCDYDVAIIGAGFSGVSAATFLGYAYRRVLVFDPLLETRNHQAKKTYNLIGYEQEPAALIANAKNKLEQFSHVTIWHSFVSSINKNVEKDHFVIFSSDNQQVRVKRIILAAGVTDVLPSIKGIDRFWPSNIFHCPYCIAYELKDEPLAIYSTNDEAYLMAKVISKYSKDLTVFDDGKTQWSKEQLKELNEMGVVVKHDVITSLSGEQGEYIDLHFAGKTTIRRRGVFIHLGFKINALSLINALNLSLSEDGTIDVDESGQTSIKGIYAVGDMSHYLQKVSHALNSANMAAFAIDHDLALIPYYDRV